MTTVTEDLPQNARFQIPDDNHSATADSCFWYYMTIFENSRDIIKTIILKKFQHAYYGCAQYVFLNMAQRPSCEHIMTQYI